MSGSIGTRRAVVDGQPAERVDRRPLEGLAARRERAGQVDRRDLADRTAEVVRAEPHEVATDGEGQHAVAGPAPLLLEDDDLAAAARRDDDVAGPERLQPRGLVGLRGPLARVEVGEEPPVLVHVAAGIGGGPAARASCSLARSSWRSIDTTSRSAWNCANDRLSRWRA